MTRRSFLTTLLAAPLAAVAAVTAALPGRDRVAGFNVDELVAKHGGISSSSPSEFPIRSRYDHIAGGAHGMTAVEVHYYYGGSASRMAQARDHGRLTSPPSIP